ncbi:DUF4245 domain-containing protein [Streptomyces sp. NPDC001691]|uniref:DUF4245 domain-containing protein n=1 Tax=unclassified Streptomyces TaxID=2593676 RepID=UPI000DEB10A4|nr:DUF4245 domain-containing protein [Streptomyces sp. SDr-06]RCH67912.1 DUF4245 domain-containing protein [Streptomyces sp. SDr-06]
MAGTRSSKQTVRNMLQSLAVIGIAAAVIYVFIPHDESDAPPLKTVDYKVELTTVRRAAPYPVAAPVGLPDQDKWRATSVSYDGAKNNAWHLGFLDPQNQYVAIEQSTAPSDKFVAEVSRSATKTEKSQQIAGATWTYWDGPKYDALVRQDQGHTTVVMGTAPYEQLVAMAGALESKKTT